jgi:hypothetical protein
MKREVFSIFLNGELIGRRFSFNASNRFVEAHVRELASHQRFQKVETRTDRDESGLYCVYGLRVWQSMSDLSVIHRYEIKKEK